MVKNQTIKLIDSQKDIFLDLSTEMFKYMNDRLKNEGICVQTERRFEELMQTILDNPDIHPGIQEVLSLLSEEFKKKSRRIKKFDEKYLNAFLKKRMKKGSSKKNQKKKDTNDLSDITEHEKEGDVIYQDSVSDYGEELKKKKKKRKIIISVISARKRNLTLLANQLVIGKCIKLVWRKM